ncbi:hypothetical protein [Streptomyces sp. NPDC056670]|uniref:hypothetical protein n=1 Tax=unclassified Streptomyces TaxID=2593676 RepID=UPI0036BC51EE
MTQPASTIDLVLPVAVVVVAGASAAYAALKRRRRAHTRTTPAGTARPHRHG